MRNVHDVMSGEMTAFWAELSCMDCNTYTDSAAINTQNIDNAVYSNRKAGSVVVFFSKQITGAVDSVQVKKPFLAPPNN